VFSQEPLQLKGRWMLRKDANSDDVPGDVIDHDSDPPAERPYLQERKWVTVHPDF